MKAPGVIRVVLVKPRERSEEHFIPNTLEALQDLVGGDLELLPAPMLRVFSAIGMHLYVHENGVALGLERNFATETDVVLGPAIVSAMDADGAEIGLSADEAAFAVGYFDGVFARSGIRPRVLEPGP